MLSHITLQEYYCMHGITTLRESIFWHIEKHFGGRILYLPEMKLTRYSPSGPCRVSKGLPKALYMKKAVPTMVKTTRIMEKRMILTWMLTGMACSKSGKTEDKPRIRRILWAVFSKCNLKFKPWVLYMLSKITKNHFYEHIFFLASNLQEVYPKI